jgi:hypothetical protein
MANFIGPSSFNLGGAIQQVVQTVDTNEIASSGYSSFSNLGGLGVTITPRSTSSKIMLLCTIGQLDHSQNTYMMYLRFTRNNTAIFTPSDGSRTQATHAVRGVLSGDTNGQQSTVIPMLIDSPSSTSALTYRVQLLNYNGSTFYYNRSNGNANSGGHNQCQSTITAMEIGV